MSFEVEKKLIGAVILAAIPLNPTNVLVDVIGVIFIDPFIGPNSMFWWIGLTFILVAKVILAVMEMEALIEIWHIFFKPSKK